MYSAFKLKKSIMIILVVCFCMESLHHAVPVKADETGLHRSAYLQLSSILSDISKDPGLFGYSNSDLGEITIGEKIPTYEYIDGITVETDFSVYPLYSNDQLFLFVYEIPLEDGTMGAQVTQAYVEELTEYCAGSNEFSLVFDSNSTYIVTSDSAKMIYKYMDNVEERDTFLSTDELMDVASQNEILYANGEPQCKISYKRNTIMPIANKQLSVPSIYQPKSNWCWAACCASIIRYFSPNTAVTATSIGNTYDGPNSNNGKELASCQIILKNYNINYNTHGGKHPTDSQILSSLNNNRPLLGHWWKNTFSHCMIIRGLNTDNANPTIYVMDPGEVGYSTGLKENGAYRYMTKYAVYVTLDDYLC